jgi:hypothetical protein
MALLSSRGGGGGVYQNGTIPCWEYLIWPNNGLGLSLALAFRQRGASSAYDLEEGPSHKCNENIANWLVEIKSYGERLDR